MSTHSSILIWEIPWTEGPGRLQSIGWQRVRHYWAHTKNHSTTYNKPWQIFNEKKKIAETKCPPSVTWCKQFNWVQFSHSVMSNSLQPHGLQCSRLPCPSRTPGSCSKSCPSSQWCHPTISSSIIPFSSCFQSFTASESFLNSQFFASGDQSIVDSASASVLPMNIQDWFPLGLTGLISLHSKGLSRVFSNTTVQKHQFFGTQLSLWSNSHIHT